MFTPQNIPSQIKDMLRKRMSRFRLVAANVWTPTTVQPSCHLIVLYCKVDWHRHVTFRYFPILNLFCIGRLIQILCKDQSISKSVLKFGDNSSTADTKFYCSWNDVQKSPVVVTVLQPVSSALVSAGRLVWALDSPCRAASTLNWPTAENWYDFFVIFIQGKTLRSAYKYMNLKCSWSAAIVLAIFKTSHQWPYDSWTPE